MTTDLWELAEVTSTAYFAAQGRRLQRLARAGQQPYALLVTCVDARLQPAQLLDAQPGDLLVTRNVAGVVPPYHQAEIGTISALEFAVLTLQVPHVVVMGHTDCGGLRGLDHPVDLARQPALARWLDLARPAQRDVDFSHRDLSPEARHEAIVARHVQLQLQNLESYPFVRQAIADGRLSVHAWILDLYQPELRVYDGATGEFSRGEDGG